jgi:3-oxoacyl-[acyl-carrier protein] reductase
MKLNKQVALVTGASGVIGSAICRALAAEGASLVLHYNTGAERASNLAEELNREAVNPTQKHIVLSADLSKDDEAQKLIAQSISFFGRLDLLINNAGWTRVVKAEDLGSLDDEIITKTMQMKIQAPLYLTRAARPYLDDSGQGQIINITSVAGIAAKGSSIIYAASNAALSSLSRSLARTLAPKIRVNAVAPGFVETGFAWPKGGEVKTYVARHNYIGRTVEAEEVATVVRFLACDASAITGEEIVIDGGIGRLGKR